MYGPIYFDSFVEYLNAISSLKGGVISPGGASTHCGVMRSTVHHWMYNSKVVRCFIYEGREGKFILIPVQDVDNYWLNSEEKAIRDAGIRRTSSSVSKRGYAKA